MAEVKIYRACYVVGEDDAARVNYSRWIQAGGEDEILAELNATTIPVGNDPTLLGWEEKTLDSDPF